MTRVWAQTAFEVVMRKASLIAITSLLAACGDENEPLRYFCAQIAPKKQFEACINDPSIRHQLMELRAAERANERMGLATNYDPRDLERSLTADIIKNAEPVEIGDLPQPLELDDKQPSPDSIYVVHGEIWADRGLEEGEWSHVYIGQIGENVASGDTEWWFAENRLLSPHQLETLEAICAFFGDVEHPICVGDIYVEIVPDQLFGGEPAVRGAKLRQPTYEEYYRKELSSLEKWLAGLE